MDSQPGGRRLPGQPGLRAGFVEPGAALAEGQDWSDYRLSYTRNAPDTTSRRPPCPFQVGDAVVIQYHAIYDDGRKLIIVDNCRRNREPARRAAGQRMHAQVAVLALPPVGIDH